MQAGRTGDVVLPGEVITLGSTSGVRLLVSRFDDGPLGPYNTVAAERADGSTLYLTPSPEHRDLTPFAADCDEVRLESVDITVRPALDGAVWEVVSPTLRISIELGPRTVFGRMLYSAPRTMSASLAVINLFTPIVRRIVRGASTRDAYPGLAVVYAVFDLRTIASVAGGFEGGDVGTIADLVPSPRFRRQSTPRVPAWFATRITLHPDASR